MTELVKYSKIGVQDLNNGTGTFEVTLADGRVITMDQVSLNALNALFPLTVTATGGLTARILPNHLGARITVTDFGDETSMPLGVATAQVALAAAVAYCYTNGKELYWPAGTYLSTATIPNFHNVRHSGPGGVKRGTDTFYPDPSSHLDTITNRLYVATTGTNTNDGLTSSEPRLTAQATGDIIYNYRYGTSVTWIINFAAGTYTASTAFTKAWPSPNRVQFLGPPVSDGVVPTATFTAPSAGNVFGLSFQMFIRVQVEDINFTNYFDSGAASATANSCGVFAADFCEIYTRNVHATNCDLGIAVWHNSNARCQAGVLTSCGIGVMALSNVVMNAGYGSSAVTADGSNGQAFINCAIGLSLREESPSHVDYCYISGATIAGLIISQNTRVNSVSNTFINCTGDAVRADALSYYFENSGNECTYTNCATNHRIRMGSVLNVNTLDTLYGPWAVEVDPVVKTTQSGVDVSLYTRTIYARQIGTRGRGLKLVVWGDIVGVANTKVLTFSLGGTTVLTVTLLAATIDFKIILELFQQTDTGTPVQKCFSTIQQQAGGVNTLTVDTFSTTIDMVANVDLAVVYHVTNVADQIRVQNIHFEVLH